MSTVFQPPVASWDSHAIHNYAAAPQTARAPATMNDIGKSQYYRYPVQQPEQQHQSQPQTTYNHYYQQDQATHSQHELPSQVPQQRNGSISTVSQAIPAVGQVTRPSTPPASTSTVTRDDAESLVYHSLTIPKCISPSGGNLADFAAQVRMFLNGWE